MIHLDTTSTFPIGSCMDMCPYDEMRTREKERLLHRLEVVPGTEHYKFPKADKNRTVKSFCRSAAGAVVSLACNLRPPEVLLKTLRYLLHDVLLTDCTMLEIYDFTADRLRAVRQDMIVQNVNPSVSIDLLGPMVRFYVYAAYRLCDADLRDFNRSLNSTQLQNSIISLISCYNFCESQNISLSSSQMKERRQMEALCVLLNIKDSAILLRYLKEIRKWKRTSLETLVLTIVWSFRLNNYIRLFRGITELPLLLACAISIHLPHFRRNVLKIMSVAYSSKNLSYPIENLHHHLLYNTLSDVTSDCQILGLKCDETKVYFLKDQYDRSVQLKPRKERFIEDKLNELSAPSFILPNYGIDFANQKVLS